MSQESQALVSLYEDVQRAIILITRKFDEFDVKFNEFEARLAQVELNQDLFTANNNPFEIEFIPKNEFGVAMLWGRLYPHLGFSMIKCDYQFPDCLMKDPMGKNKRIEIEYQASNFIKHNHNEEECDIIVCWKNDISPGQTRLPIIALEDYFRLDPKLQVEK
ncbi:MAG: hypothetical protein ACXACI_13035 [Candidatus Hodarchaeales archaeon]